MHIYSVHLCSRILLPSHPLLLHADDDAPPPHHVVAAEACKGCELRVRAEDDAVGRDPDTHVTGVQGLRAQQAQEHRVTARGKGDREEARNKGRIVTPVYSYVSAYVGSCQVVNGSMR